MHDIHLLFELMSNKLMIELSKYHSEWCKIVRSFGVSSDTCEDVVQDMYLRLNKLSSYEKLFKNGTISKSYVWITLRNLQFQQFKQDNLTISLSNYDIQIDENCTLDEVKARSNFNVKINKEVCKWNMYDQLLFSIYMNDSISMRDISKGSGITLRSIQRTLENCYRRLRQNVGEDYQDLINKDYELI